MPSKESSTSPVQPSEELERAASELEEAYTSDFTGYGIGRLLTYSAAFARLVEPHVPASVRGMHSGCGARSSLGFARHWPSAYGRWRTFLVPPTRMMRPRSCSAIPSNWNR